MSPLTFAHRGYSGKYPENTLLAFKKAIESGCDGIELDVHFSKDGELMVIHDFTVDRTTESEGNIGQYTKAELQDMRIDRSEKIPTLDQVFLLLDQYSSQEIQLNIELKAGSRIYKDIENAVIKMIYKYDYRPKTIVSSFDHKAIYKMKEIDESIKTGALTGAAMYKPWEYLKSLKVDYYHPHYLTVDDQLIEESIKQGILLNLFTVNDEITFRSFMEAPINSIITNYPELRYC